MKKIEILAPAGSYESLEAAVLAGADAVYVGGNKFGARAFANNFSEEQMLEAIDFVHLHDRKIYMTVNTLLKEKEIEKYIEGIEELNDFYKEQASMRGVLFIMCVVPVIAFIIHFRIGNNISELTCAVIAGMIEIAMIFMFDPEFIKRKSINYFFDNGNKMYIYRRIDKETVLCGDNPSISKAKKYKSISYDVFKRLEINHVVYRKLSDDRKRELRKIYNDRRDQ